MYPAPGPWAPPEGEDPRVSALRTEHAIAQRRWLAKYVGDPNVSAHDLLAAFSQISYNDARKLAALSLEVQCHCIPEHEFVCNKCRKEAA